MLVKQPILEYDTDDENDENFNVIPPRFREELSLKLFSKLKKSTRYLQLADNPSFISNRMLTKIVWILKTNKDLAKFDNLYKNSKKF